MRKLLLVCAALAVAMPAGAAHRYFRGGFGYGPWYGGWGYWPAPYYNPYYYGYGVRPNVGEIRLDTNLKDAQVYLNGAYAGTAGKLKSMWLRPGAYNLEVRAPDRSRYAERVYVVGGKTLHVRPELRAGSRP